MVRFCSVGFVLVVALLISGCEFSPAATPVRAPETPPAIQRATAQPTATVDMPTAAPQPATATPTATRVSLPTVVGTQAPSAGLVSAGKRKLYLSCTGTGSPTVVMDAGLDGTSAAWSSVVPRIATITRVCIYDRANLGRSEKAPRPRTSQDIVDDLHGLLASAAVPAPYILVGHSLGGLNVRLYASEFTEQVVGLLLVDAWHEDTWNDLVSLMPPPAEGEPQAYKTYRAQLQNPIQGSEQVDLQTSGAQVKAQRKSFGSLPLIILSHGKPMPEVPKQASPLFELLWGQLQMDLLSQSSNSKRIVATQSGHGIQFDQPQLVIDAVREMVTDLRGR